MPANRPSRILRLVASVAVAAVTIAAAPAATSGTGPAVLGSDETSVVVDAAPGWAGMRAGVAVVDATWNVGAAAGQYTDYRAPQDELSGGDMDPHAHHVTKQASYGVQSRLTIRAIVVEGANGERVALVKSDNYLAQDHLLRRVGQLLAEGDSGVAYDRILHAASHNHSSPYYATPSWGVWLFQDVMDLRMFEYQARAMASAIEEAAADLRPARMGATTVRHDLYKGNIVRSQTAEDGSPVGFPNDYGDAGLVVVRFDDMTAPTDPQPLAVWTNWGQHPESLDGYDLITADFLAPLERFVERETGAALVFSQGDVGSAEGPYASWNRGETDDGTAIAWAHMGHAQTERGARYLADSVVEAYDAIGRGDAQVPFTTDAEVGMISEWVPAPVSHPYPSVSNCRTEETAGGDPGAPILGLPDCERAGFPTPLAMAYENLKAHGIPVPDHYDAPAFTAVEENLRLRLQVVKLGDVMIGSCACEAQVDLILNFESRADDLQGNVHDGFDWLDDPNTTCHRDGSGTWTCVYDDPDARASRTWTFSDAAFQRWQAQVHNDASGWDALENILVANSEPHDTADILGNFTHAELPPELGSKLVVGVGHAGDYNGYTVSYREYMAYDHYRKALTCCGPHTADYMVTRLVAMAGELNGGPAYDGEPHEPVDPADEARQVALSVALGQASSAAYEAWLAALADDVGPAEVLDDPSDITRFDAAEIRWRGGSNAVDNPLVRVERLTDDGWRTHADASGEIQTMVDLPDGVQGVADTHTGSQEWVWTANFEAFTGGPDPDLPSTPAGTYRFVVDGHIQQDGVTERYQLTSAPFEVAAWEGIEVGDLQLIDGAASFAVAPIHYPPSYDSSFPYIQPDTVDGRTGVCLQCTFRAWAGRGAVTEAWVSVLRSDGTVDRYPAVPQGDRWIAHGLDLRASDQVVVARGDVVDRGGNINGLPSATLAVTGRDVADGRR